MEIMVLVRFRFLFKEIFILNLILAINFGALNNLLQMFSNNMNISANKPPLLPPPPPGTSSNMTLSSQHGSNQSLNIQDQHTLNSPRPPPPNLNTNTYNNDSSLLMCSTNAYTSGGPSPNNGNVPPTTHHNQNGGLTSSVATPATGSYIPTMPSMYANSGSPLSNNCAGRISNSSTFL